MSRVTDIILVTGCESELAMELIPSLRQLDDKAGGNKAMQCDLMLAAINYLDEYELLERFNATAWLSPECVQLMLKGEEDDTFSVHSPIHSS